MNATAANVPGAGMLLPFRDSLRAMVGLAFVTMMVAIDMTVVGTALPTVVAELRGFQLYAWVTTAYLLTSIITIPIFGRLGDYYGRKPFVVTSIVLFLVSSVFCALAQSMMQMVWARALQGIGGGMMIGTVFAVVPDLFPDPRVRLRWQVILSSAFGIANAFGPSLGGFLTYYVGWRSVFLMNVPLGLLGLYYVVRYVPRIRYMQQKDIRLDWQGAVLIALTLTGLQFLVQLLPLHGATISMVLLGVGTVACFSAFLWWENRCKGALIPLEMFSQRGVGLLCLLSFILGFVTFGLLIYVPLLLQGGFGLNVREVGMLITPMVVAITVGSLVTSRYLPRMRHPERLLQTGFLLLSVCTGGLVLMDAHTARAILVTVLLGCGLGMGLIMLNLTVFVQELVNRTLLGISTALLQSTRMVGGMVGTALLGSMVTHFYVERVKSLDVTPYGDGRWLSRLEDPQVLVDPQIQSSFVAALQRLGLHGEIFIDHARESLVWGVHAGLAVATLVSLVGLFWLFRLPHIELGRNRVQSSSTTVGPQEAESSSGGNGDSVGRKGVLTADARFEEAHSAKDSAIEVRTAGEERT